MAATDQLSGGYRAITEDCGLLDRSERGKLLLRGAGAIEFLNGQVTNDVTALERGQGQYAAFLTHKGKMLGDLRVLRTDATSLWLDTERVALQALFDMIRRFKVGFDVELQKRTLEHGLLSLIGPRAREVAGAAGLEEARELPGSEHSNVTAIVDGIETLAIVTDTGLDLVCESERTAELAERLEGAGAQRVTDDAAEVVRVESGRPRFGLDIGEDTIPQEAGLNDRAVSFTKGCYVGQETVARLHWRGKPNRHLRGLELSAPAQTGAPLYSGERALGTLGTTVVSPRRGPIALALVRREAQPGDTVEVGAEGTGARVVALPFAS